MKNNKVAYLFLLPFMTMFILFLVIPTLWGIILSFTDYNGISIESINFVGFANYHNLIDSDSVYFKDFWMSIIRTIGYVVLITPFLIMVPLMIAQVINSLKFGKGIIQGMFYIPVVLSVAGVATLAGWFFDQKYGLFNYFLSHFGIDNIPWLTQPTTAIIAISLLTVWWTMGGNLIIYSAALSGVPQEMYEAADLEGASKFKKFFKITIPTIKPQLMFTFIMSTIATFNIYGQVSILTGGGPGMSTTSAAVYIRNTAFGSTQAAGMASAMGIVFGLMLIGITYFQFKTVIREL